MNDTSPRGVDRSGGRSGILRRFEAAWRGSARPSLDDLLDSGGVLEPSLLVELIHIDLDFRLRRGEPARVEEYVRRYPALGADRSALLGLVEAEAALRGLWGDAPTPEEYAGRFPDLWDGRQGHAHAPSPTLDQSAEPRPPAAPSPSFPGYAIERELGRGGMGVVYLGRQVELGRLVAIKTLLPDGDPSGAEGGRFRREAEAIARLDHPHIVPIYEVGEHDRRPYFTMKYYPGGSLARPVDARVADVRGAARLVETVALAVHHAHQRGILHRDLKPSNILLDEQGRPHVVDFGLAGRVDPGAEASTGFGLVGTPCYVAPEQARHGHAATTASDVYGLGAILYELLTGAPPFWGPTALSTLLEVLERPPRRPSLLNPRVPVDLETLCLKCLEKDPSRRIPGALDLADELGRWRRGEPIRSRPIGPLGRLRRVCRRRPALATLTAAVALLILAGSGGTTYFALRADRERREALAAATRALGEERLAREHLYRAEIQLAQGAWREGRFGPLERLLERQRPGPGAEDLRGFEWRYLQRLGRGDLVLDHPAEVRCLAVSPDGRWIAAGGSDGTLCVWDARDGRERLRLARPGGAIVAVSFNAEGTSLATARAPADRAGRGEVCLWDARTGRLGRTLVGVRGVARLAFRPDGAGLYTASREEVADWDLATGQKRRAFQGHRGPITALALSRDGSLLAAGGPSVTIWETGSGTIRRSLKGPKGPAVALDFSPDGTRLVTGGCCPGDFSATIWDLATGVGRPAGVSHAAEVTGVAFGPDGRRVASASEDARLRLFDANTGRPDDFLGGHGGPITAVAFGRDGAWVASAGRDRRVKVWDLRGDRAARTVVAHGVPVAGLAFGDDGGILASVGGAHALGGREGERPGEIRLWDPADGRLLRTLEGHAAPVRSVVIGPGSRWLASGSWDHTVRVWDVPTGRCVRTLACDLEVNAVACSPDGARIAAGGGGGFKPSSPGEVRVWEASSGRLLLNLTADLPGVRCLAFSPDGRLLAIGGVDGSLRFIDAGTGRTILRFAGHAGAVLAVGFRPDGRTLASSAGDRSTRLWDVATGRAVLRLEDGVGMARGLGFTRDGRRLLTAGDDGPSLRVWDGRSGLPVLNLPGGRAGLVSLAIDPTGRRIAAGAEDGTLTIWEAGP